MAPNALLQPRHPQSGALFFGDTVDANQIIADSDSCYTISDDDCTITDDDRTITDEDRTITDISDNDATISDSGAPDCSITIPYAYQTDDDDRTVTEIYEYQPVSISDESEARETTPTYTFTTNTMATARSTSKDMPIVLGDSPVLAPVRDVPSPPPQIPIKSEHDMLDNIFKSLENNENSITNPNGQQQQPQSVLGNSQVDGLLSMLRLAKQEDGNDEQVTAQKAEDDGQQQQAESSDAPSQGLFGHVDLDNVDLDNVDLDNVDLDNVDLDNVDFDSMQDIYEDALSQQVLFSMDSQLAETQVDEAPLDNTFTESPAKHDAPKLSCAERFKEKGGDWLGDLPVRHMFKGKIPSLDTATDNNTSSSGNPVADLPVEDNIQGTMEKGNKPKVTRPASKNQVEATGVKATQDDMDISSEEHTDISDLNDINEPADNASAKESPADPMNMSVDMDGEAAMEDVDKAPVADMQPGIDEDSNELVPYSQPKPDLPTVSAEDAVATQLAGFLNPEPAPQELDEFLPDAPPAEDVPAAEGDQNPEPVNVDNPANADKEESMFVEPHPQVPENADAAQDDADLALGLDMEGLGFSVQGPDYAWKDIDKMPDGRAIRVLEESVNSALACGRKVLDELDGNGGVRRPEHRIEADKWKKQFEAICAEQRDFQVHIGVSGRTGAGKTTLINALLDLDELLPSGSDGAATATVCRVHQATPSNGGDEKKGEGEEVPPFRAVVTFKTKTQMKEWLEPILGDIADYYAHKARMAKKEADRRAKEAAGADDSDSDDDLRELDSDSDEDDDDSDATSEEEEDDDDFVPDKETKEQRAARESRKSERIKKREAKQAERDKKRADKERERQEREEKRAAREEKEAEDDFDKGALEKKLECVTKVFGRDLDQLCGWTVADLLNKRAFPIVKLVGHTKTIVSDTRSAFSKAIKMYMDSTAIPAGYDYSDYDKKEGVEEDEVEDVEEVVEEEDGEGGEGEDEEEDEGDEDEEGDDGGEEEEDDEDDEGVENFLKSQDESGPSKIFWPIVDHIDIYLKDAPLLANGIVLTDLPGLADSNEDRAAISRRYFEQLNITMVVAPSIRAGDDDIVSTLLSQSEKYHLRLGGSLNKRAFCVVTSKIDDLKWTSYLENTVMFEAGNDLKRDQAIYKEILARMDTVSKELSNFDTIIEELAMDIEIEERDISQVAKEAVQQKKLDILSHKTACMAYRKQYEAYEIWLAYYQGLLAYHASQFRNAKVRGKIQEIFRREAVDVLEKQEKENAIKAKRAAKEAAKEKAKEMEKAKAAGLPNDVAADAPAAAPVEAPVGGQQAAPKEPPKIEPIDVLPVSADAYWDIREDQMDRDTIKRKPKLRTGFPNASFTGIPAMRAWIRAATIPMRQRKAISLLTRLSVLLQQLKTGFGEASEGDSESEEGSQDKNIEEIGDDAQMAQAEPSQSDVNDLMKAVEEIFNGFKDILVKNLNISTDKLVERISMCNPMAELAFNQPARVKYGADGEKAANGRKPRFTTSCKRQVIDLVETWQYRKIRNDAEPGGMSFARKKAKPGGSRGKGKKDKDIDDSSFLPGTNGKPVRMPWMTHGAIIRRHGGPYISTGKLPGSYRWMRDMTNIVLKDVVAHWETGFHARLPREIQNGQNVLKDAWGRALKRLQVRLSPLLADNKEAETFLRQNLTAMVAIRDSAINAAQNAMENVGQQGKDVSLLVENELSKGWKSAFDKAINVSGVGLFASRRELLKTHAIHKTNGLVKSAMMAMDKLYKANVGVFQETLKEVWTENFAQVCQLVDAMQQRVAEANGKVGYKGHRQLDNRARFMHSLILQWEGDWKTPDVCAQMDVDGGGHAGVEKDRGNEKELVSGGCAGDMAPFPEEYMPEPTKPSFEDVLPDIAKQLNGDDVNEGGDADNNGDNALNDDLTNIPAKGKRAPKRKAADDGKPKATPKKRKTAAVAPKGQGGVAKGGAAKGKAAASKAGGAKGATATKGGKAAGGAKGGAGARGGRGKGKK